MFTALKQLDRILRGDATRTSELRDGRIEIPVGGLSMVVVGLAIVGGLCLGSFAVIRAAWSEEGISGGSINQLLASAVKMPLLFAMTLVVTFPSLYVFNALVGSRLTMQSVARLLVAMLGVMMAVLASLGPIIVFFGLSTESYPFMKLLNVAMASVAGILGLAFLLRTLQRLAAMQDLQDSMAGRSDTAAETRSPVAGSGAEDDAMVSADSPADAGGGAPAEAPETSSAGSGFLSDGPARPTVPSPLDRIRSPATQRATTVFRIWMVVFAVVGAQMSWVMRPFIGSPDLPFQWFRPRQSNFFQDVFRSLAELFGA